VCTNSSKDIRANKKLRTIEEVEEYFPGFIAFIDCPEQQIPRPEDKRRKMYYSLGKKKRNTVNTQLMMVNNRGLIIHNTNHKKGRRHDYNICRIKRKSWNSQSSC
jgi:hypothetical protein